MSLEQILTGRPDVIRRDPVTATVIRSDVSGVWVSALGSDTRHPVGPCRGARRRDIAGVPERLPVGTVVLLVFTDQGPWVAAWDEED